MVDVGITLDEVSMARVKNALQGLSQNTGRTMYQSVMYAANLVCQSGRADSRPAMKLRKIQKNPLAMGRKVKGRDLMQLSAREQRAFMIEAFSQKRGRFTIYTNNMNDRRRAISKRETARNIWNVMAAKFAAFKGGVDVLNSPISGPATIGAETDKLRVLGARSTDNAMALLHNKLGYLEAAYPGQTLMIVNKAMSRAEYFIDKATDKAVEVANRG
jgi:hypothetical protein